MAEKVITGFLVVGWRDEKLKVRKTEPDDLSPYQMALEIDLAVEVPDLDTPTISEKLKIPQPTVERMVQQQVTGGEAEEWMEVADHIIQKYEDTGNPLMLPGDINKALGEVMLEAEGVPDPEAVRQYIQEVA